MLEDLLESNEAILYRHPYNTEFRGDRYNELVVSSKRIIFYKREGLIFKKDQSAIVGLSNINSIKFKEKGVLRKKGILEIVLREGTGFPLVGDASAMKHLYHSLMSRIE